MKKWVAYVLVLLLLQGSSLEKPVTVEGRMVGATLPGTSYVPLYPVAEALGADAMIWDPAMGEVRVLAKGVHFVAVLGEDYVTVNGRVRYLPGGVLKSGDGFYMPPELLAWCFGGTVEDGLTFSRSDSLPESGETFYDEESVLWLARLIRCEAEGESLEGKVAVGNVVLNRVASPDFPDTVKEVIFDRRSAIQFSPAYTKAIYRDPTPEAILAAKLALEGDNTAGESLYFASLAASKTCWANKNREKYATIDHQVFYL